MSTRERDRRECRSCPVCGGSDLEHVARFDAVVVHCNLLWWSRKEAIAAPRADLELAVCRACAHVFNVLFDPVLMRYDERYENALDFSEQFRAYAVELADRLIERHTLRAKTIVEVGCGDGEFLKLLCRRGGNRGVGFDLGMAAVSVDRDPGLGVRLVPGELAADELGGPADFVCCRHVLEHVEDPGALLATITRAVSRGGSEAGAYFEVPNALATLRDLLGWDVIYEHFSYFTRASLIRLLNGVGIEAREVRESFGGQFLSAEAVVPAGAAGGPARAETRAADEREVAEALRAARSFGERWRARTDELRARLERLRAGGKRVVVWGAGSKGTMFLNVLGEAARIERAVDINPRKHGRFVAGGGQQIVAPEALREQPPDVVVVMNPNYRDEIGRTLASLGLAPELVLV